MFYDSSIKGVLFSKKLRTIVAILRIDSHLCTPIPSQSGAIYGGLAQLARALAWHARGHRFESDILHFSPKPDESSSGFFMLPDKNQGTWRNEMAEVCV